MKAWFSDLRAWFKQHSARADAQRSLRRTRLLRRRLQVEVLENRITPTKITPTVVASDAGGTFSGAAFAATATVTDPNTGNPVTGGTVSFTYSNKTTGTSSSTAPTSAGSYEVVASFTPASGSQYTNAKSAGVRFSITQAGPTVAVTDAGGTFSGQAFGATATVAGVVSGVDSTPASSLEGVTPTFDYIRINSDGTQTDLGSSAPTAAGNYQVVATFAGSTDYRSASQHVSFSIHQTVPTVSVTDAGGTFSGQAFGATATVAGVVSGVDSTPAGSLEGVTPTFDYIQINSDGTQTDLGSSAPTAAGNYQVVATFAGSTDYKSAQQHTSFSIHQTVPTVSVTDAGGTFSGQAFGATATVAGVVSGVDSTPASSLEGVTPTFDYIQINSDGTQTDLGSSAPTAAGNYQVVATFAGSTDYKGAQQHKSFSITRAVPSVAVTDNGGLFTGQPYAATATVAGVVSGLDSTPASSLEGVTPTLDYVQLNSDGTQTDLGSTAPSAVGNYEVTASFAGSGDYTSAQGSTSFSILSSQATPSVTVTDGSGTYTGQPFAATGSVTGVDSIALGTPTFTYYSGTDTSGTPLASAPTDVGTYTVVASFAGNDAYTAASAQTTFTISQATPTVSVSDNSGNYTGSSFAASGSVTGAGGADLGSPTFTYYAGTDTSGTPLAGAPTDVGTYTVLASYAGSTDYSSASNTATFTISQATPTVTVTDAGGTYNGSAFVATGSVTGVNNIDLGTPTFTYYVGSDTSGTQLSGAPTNAGTYTVLASFAGGGNYSSGTNTATFTIGQATPTVSVNWSGWTYDGTAHLPTGSVTGLNNANLGSPTFTYYAGNSASGTPLAGAPTGAGTYTVLASYAGGNNYLPASNSATVTVAQQAATFTNLTDISIVVGTSSIFISGSIPAGTLTPGASIIVTLGNQSVYAYMHPDGTFSTSLWTADLGVGAYTISYQYSGGTNFTGCLATSGLDITYNVQVAYGSSQPRGSGASLPLFVGVELTDVNGAIISSPAVPLTVVGIAPASDPTAVMPIKTSRRHDGQFRSHSSGVYTMSAAGQSLASGTYLLYFTAGGDPITLSMAITITV